MWSKNTGLLSVYCNSVLSLDVLKYNVVLRSVSGNPMDVQHQRLASVTRFHVKLCVSDRKRSGPCHNRQHLRLDNQRRLHDPPLSVVHRCRRLALQVRGL